MKITVDKSESASESKQQILNNDENPNTIEMKRDQPSAENSNKRKSSSSNNRADEVSNTSNWHKFVHEENEMRKQEFRFIPNKISSIQANLNGDLTVDSIWLFHLFDDTIQDNLIAYMSD